MTTKRTSSLMKLPLQTSFHCTCGRVLNSRGAWAGHLAIGGVHARATPSAEVTPPIKKKARIEDPPPVETVLQPSFLGIRLEGGGVPSEDAVFNAHTAEQVAAIRVRRIRRQCGTGLTCYSNQTDCSKVCNFWR